MRADETTICPTAEFERLLLAVRSRVYRWAIGQRLVVASERVLLAMALLAGTYLLLGVASVVMRRPVWIEWQFYVWVAGGVLVAILAVTMIGTIRRRPSWNQAAERLDLAADDHNRVATALWLAEQGIDTPFARAAMQDGLVRLRRIASRKPHLDAVPMRWRRGGALGGAIVVLTAAALLCGRVDHAPRAQQAPALAVTPIERRLPSGDLPEAGREAAKTPALTSQPPDAGSAATGAAAATATRPTGVRTDSAAGRAGGNTRGPANPAGQTAGTRGESTGASSTAQPRPPRQPNAYKAKPPRESATRRPEKVESQESSSAISQGSSGGGSMSPVSHDWSQRARSVEGDPEEDQTDEEVEDESESNTQRGGIQPSLKDRNESPSRELGISGEQGPPGTGRGGPTPPKKSRGTASLVLGVPIPDFVRGRVGPGTTKITHERVEPSPMAGDPTSPVSARSRDVSEAPHRRFQVPPSLATVVRDYLIALHSSDRNAPAEKAPALPPGSLSPQE